MSVKERVRELVEIIPEEDLATVERMLRGLLTAESDPLLSALAAAPEDDEPYTEEDAHASARGRKALARGECIPHEEVVRRSRERQAQAA